MDKEHLKMISAFEQGAGFLGEFASLLAAYHSQLCDKGFQRPEALVLVKELQSILFSQSFNLTPPTDED